MGVRLAPAAVAVGEVGHREDAGQQRQMYQPEQAHDDKGCVCEHDQMLFVMIRFLEKGPDAVKHENIASERAARAAGCCIFIILRHFYTISLYNEIRTMNRWNFRMTVCIKNTSAKNFGYKS